MQIVQKSLTFRNGCAIIISETHKKMEVRKMLTAICIIDAAIIGVGIAMLSGAVQDLW